MSALAGMLYKDPHHPVEKNLLRTLENALSHLGPDNSTVLVKGRVGFVYRAFHSTEESHRETQPYYHSGIVATFDGRIDNRDDLISSLNCDANVTDAELLVKAYQTWKQGAFTKLLGDFAAVVWDQERQRLLLARDPFGIRKLFYVSDNSRLLWSSDIGSLLRLPRVSSEIDESFIGISLTLLPDGSSTGFKDVQPVKAGHVMIFDESGLRSSAFWGIENCLAYKSPTSQPEIQNEFLHLLKKAVGAVCRTDRPVTAELSGGLDSSTIVCLAHELFSGADHPTIDTLSFVYNNAYNADERKYISIVEEHIGRVGSHLLEDDDPILSRWPDPEFVSYPNRLHCFGGAVDAVLRDMQARNSRVLLSGEFGDQLFISSHLLPYSATDLIRQGRILGAIRTCHAWSLSKRQPFFPILWHAAIRPHLPMSLRRSQQYAGQGPRLSPAHFKMPSWIGQEFATRTKLRQKVASLLNEDALYRAGSSGIRFANMRQCVGWFTSGYAANVTSQASIEMRYPYSYRPLVEFLISLPYAQLSSDVSARHLQRRSLKGILPEAIRLRTDKRGPHQAIMLAVKRQWPQILEMIDTSIACSRGYVSKPALKAEAHGWFSGQSISDFLKFVAVERWLQALQNANLLRP